MPKLFDLISPTTSGGILQEGKSLTTPQGGCLHYD